MLSILIPVYNFVVLDLVADLHRQCREAGCVFEIICLDDGSKKTIKEKNTKLLSISYVKYIELKQNIGRATIRNRLSEIAEYPYLLFLDVDSKVIRDDYIQTYLNALDPSVLLYGGRSYDHQPPKDQQFLLHWTFGCAREMSSPKDRNQAPYTSFMTNNFLIHKDIFQSIRFDESISDYGHEDTLFGLALQKKAIPILHLDNPLEHIGLESSEVFLNKQQLAIQNLRQLGLSTRLSQKGNQLRSWKMAGSFVFIFRLFEPLVLKQLHSTHPNLFLLDLWKLYRFLLE